MSKQYIIFFCLEFHEQPAHLVKNEYRVSVEEGISHQLSDQDALRQKLYPCHLAREVFVEPGMKWFFSVIMRK